ncbi:MAG: glycosyltransferase [Alistipes sp.]|nr:glycosyltransferase [Alistipes sp.]
MKESCNISVLMAVHNGVEPLHLHEALESLHNQTLPPRQIILVEDGKLNNPLKRIIAKWRWVWRHRLTIVRNRKNRGLTASLNRGLGQVRYPLIARMDSDDIAHPKRFERQAQFLAQHPEVAILGGAIEEFDGTATRKTNTRHYPPTHEEALRSIHRASPLAHPAVMMRREVFRSGLRYNERYRTSQDIALWFDAICAGYRIANLRETVLYYRLDDSTFRRRTTRKAWGELKIYCSGIRRLYGVISWRYIFPIGRFLSRLMPSGVIRRLYRSDLRKLVVE